MHHNEEEGGLVLLLLLLLVMEQRMKMKMMPLLGPLPSSLPLLEEAVYRWRRRRRRTGLHASGPIDDVKGLTCHW
jgi:hypothetical protein